MGLLLHYFPFGRGFIHASYDVLLVARGERPAKEAVIVYLDERSHLELQQPLNAPWDRALHAKLIDQLTAAGAKSITFDVVFSDPALNNPTADETLARAIRNSGRVILAADRIPLGGGNVTVIPPIEFLRTNAANIGSAEVKPSPDLVVREHTPEEELPSLSWATAEFCGAAVTTNDAVRAERRWINYYGPPGMIKGMSYVDALKGGQDLKTFCDGKVVFVGSRILTKFAGERKDEYRNPFGFFSRHGEMFVPGVEIQATMTLNLLHEDWLRRASDTVERIVIVLLGLAVGYGLMRSPPLTASIAGAVALTVVFGLCWGAMVFKLSWFVFFIAAVQIGLALLVSVVYNSLQAYVQKRLAEQTLALYLSPKLVKKFASNPRLMKPGAEKQLLTLFFSDIADFTKMSEGMDSDELAHLMNEYFEAAVSQCVHKTDGTVVKYIGDAIFAFWNAPEGQEDHALRACQAALLFREFATKPVRGRILHTRIGLHTGVANVGNFGSAERVDYTALGESVNFASRLEGLNKHINTNLLISEETKKAIGEQLVTRRLGKFRFKGFDKSFEVHELVGWGQEAEATRAWRETFAAALEDYVASRFREAKRGFERTLELRPHDGPSTFYLERISELSEFRDMEGWTGEYHLKDK